MLRGSFDAVVCCCLCVLQKLYIAREWVVVLPVTHMFKNSLAFSSSTPRLAVVPTDPHVCATVSQRPAFKVGIPAPPVNVF
jgi:hypothetical protein